MYLRAAAIMIVLWSTTAFAMDEYYIALSSDKGRCELLEIPPQTTAFKLLADGKVYFEKEEARDAMASLPECRRVSASDSRRQTTGTN
jgi:hypothetical protein